MRNSLNWIAAFFVIALGAAVVGWGWCPEGFATTAARILCFTYAAIGSILFLLNPERTNTS